MALEKTEREAAQKRGSGQVYSLGDLDFSRQEPDDHFDREWVSHLVEVALARLQKSTVNTSLRKGIGQPQGWRGRRAGRVARKGAGGMPEDIDPSIGLVLRWPHLHRART